MLHSNPGDYAWGQSGLDAIVTQVRPWAGAVQGKAGDEPWGWGWDWEHPAGAGLVAACVLRGSSHGKRAGAGSRARPYPLCFGEGGAKAAPWKHRLAPPQRGGV